jgi:hypothetical protein
MALKTPSRVRVDHSERPGGKERSARVSESEVNSNRSVSLGRQGRLDYVFRHLCFPAFKPLPIVFLKPVGYLSFSSAADLDHAVPWGLGREAPLVREPAGCAPRCRVGQGCVGHRARPALRIANIIADRIVVPEQPRWYRSHPSRSRCNFPVAALR